MVLVAALVFPTLPVHARVLRNSSAPNSQPVAIEPTACRDWSAIDATTYEQGVAEYLRFARQPGPKDWSCMNRATWQVMRHLFDPDQEMYYDRRMLALADEFERA